MCSDICSLYILFLTFTDRFLRSSISCAAQSVAKAHVYANLSGRQLSRAQPPLWFDLLYSFLFNRTHQISQLLTKSSFPLQSRLLLELNVMLSYGSAERSLALLWKTGLLEILLPLQAEYLAAKKWPRTGAPERGELLLVGILIASLYCQTVACGLTDSFLSVVRIRPKVDVIAKPLQLSCLVALVDVDLILHSLVHRFSRPSDHCSFRTLLGNSTT